LLATVHWVAKHEGAANSEEAIGKTYNWNERKRMFQEKHIRAGWKLLSDKGWLKTQSAHS